MIHALKYLKPCHLVPSSPFRSQIGREPTASLRFIQATPKSDQETPSMEKQEMKPGHVPCPPDKTEDVMSHSFGEGYKTRSDEEGFGGIYGGNQSEEEVVDMIDVSHVLHPEYDKSQGCEVKEKERARNQTEASS
uniref:Late embryogenesis abundant protein n=1 Tax=Kalanchoe fedtschenkoi TaxID=63787 RepID=A0A7N0T8N8_KALFE